MTHSSLLPTIHPALSYQSFWSLEFASIKNRGTMQKKQKVIDLTVKIGCLVFEEV
jgi:hypothetical protein